MRKNGPVSMPFARSTADAPAKVIEMARRAQSAVYNSFNVRRNSRRVDRFFVLLRASRADRALAIAWSISILLVISVSLVLMRMFYTGGTLDKREQIADSIFSSAVLAISRLMDEPAVLSEVIGKIYSHEEIPNKGTAAEIALTMVKAYQASSKTIACMNVGVNDGMYIGVVTDGGNLSWLFSEVRNNRPDYLYIWETNEDGIAEGYPYTGGTQLNVRLNTTGTDWYQQGQTFKETEWGRLYFDKVQNIPILAATTPVRDPDWEQELLFVVALEMKFSTIRDVLEQQITDAHSRFAITSESGFLVAVTDLQGTSADLDDGVIVKTLDELGDPVWKCVASDPRFGEDNFTIQCVVDGVDVTYSVKSVKVATASGGTADWILYGALEMKGGDDEVENSKFIIIPLVVYALGMVVGVLGYRLINFMRVRQSRILFSKSKKEMAFQTEEIGIGKALEIIRRTDIASYDNPTISKEVREIYKDLLDMNRFDGDASEFLKRIEDERVREKFQRKFNIAPKEAVDIGIANREMIRINNNDDDERTEDISGETETEMGSYLRSRNIGTAPVDVNKAVDILSETISEACPFHRKKLREFLEDLVEQVGPDNAPFLVDSFDFCQQILSSRAQKYLYDECICSSLMFALLLFHLHMKDRTVEDKPFLDRYFITNQSAFIQMCNEKLVDLYQCRTRKKEARQAWENIIEYVRLLADTAAVKHHFEAIFKCRYDFMAHTRDEMQTKKDVMRLVFCAATVSFLFDKPDVVYRAHCMLNGTNELDDVKPLSGLNQEYVLRMYLGLQQLTGSRFLLCLVNTCV